MLARYLNNELRSYGTVILLLAAVIYGGTVSAQNDLKGSADHPLLSRYAGSYILGYDKRDYDQLVLPLGPYDIQADRFSKSQTVEGNRTRILYVAPTGRSSLEVFRNYEIELKKAGFQVQYSCSAKCGFGFHYPMYSNRQLANADNAEALKFVLNFVKDEQYLWAKLERPEMTYFVSLYVAVDTFDHLTETVNRALALLEIVEIKPMQTSMVTLNMDSMRKGLAAEGKIALYGIYFDTDKAEIKPESKPQLEEMAKLLKANPKLKVYIVGHTDNQGALDYNRSLSQRRADAVVLALTSQYGVEAKRLAAHGVASLSPLASNASDGGRAKNRRVELVEQ